MTYTNLIQKLCLLNLIFKMEFIASLYYLCVYVVGVGMCVCVVEVGTCMSVVGLGYAHVCTPIPVEAGGALDPLELELQMVVCTLMWVLGTYLCSSLQPP